MFLLSVEGMSCHQCVRHVTQAIHSQDPKARVEIKLSEGLVHVESGVDLEKIKRAIENDGYRVVRTEQRP